MSTASSIGMHHSKREELSLLEHAVSNILQMLGHRLADEWQRVHERFEVTYKGQLEPVSAMDIWMEDELRRELGGLLPEAGFIVEEGESRIEEGYNWIIDPIDQTKNFIGHLPLFYSQVALVHEGQVVLGVIHNPVSRQTFSASEGNGAKLNGNILTSHARQNLEECIVDIDFGGKQGADWKMAVLDRLAPAVNRIRLTGGAYSPYIATGSIDAYLVLNQETKMVDQLPRMIVARETGLRFETMNIGEHTIYLSAHEKTFGELIALVSRL